MMTARKVGILAVGLAGMLAAGQLVSVGKAPPEADEPQAKAKEKLGDGKRAKEFIAAYEKGDAKAVAGFWTPDGEYTDLGGRTYKGRPAIEKLYAGLFAENKGAKLAIHVTSAKMLSPDVALEEGITEVKSPNGPPSTARFAAVLVKKDGEWYLENIRDVVARPPTNADHFDDLAWLIGEWKGVEDKGESTRSSYSWAENGNFIVSHFTTTVDDIPVIGGTQWIAWDAIDKQVRSWTFYSGGGFGESLWTQDGDKWVIKVTARSADGKKLSATNTLTKTGADTATWQMTKLTVNGEVQPDPKPVKVKRVTPARS
jgi:uncharacterized protein (TIGR02246 family)